MSYKQNTASGENRWSGFPVCQGFSAEVPKSQEKVPLGHHEKLPMMAAPYCLPCRLTVTEYRKHIKRGHLFRRSVCQK